MSTQALDVLARLAKQGSIRQLDYQFARFVASLLSGDELSAEEKSAFLLLVAAVSAELGKGNICLALWDSHGSSVDLSAKLGLYGEAALAVNPLWVNADWNRILPNSKLVGLQGEAVPLMFDGQRLYLHRYWHYEVTLAHRLQSFGSPMILKPTDVQKPIQAQKLRELLDVLFERDYRFLFKALKSSETSQVSRQRMVCDFLDVVDDGQLNWTAIDAVLTSVQRMEDLQPLNTLVPASSCLNWQKVAAAVALTRRFAVISGGPGTGKTTTVTKLLAALIRQSQQQGHTPNIKLVAPTGKAAARLTESIGKAVESLAVEPDLKSAIPTTSSTIHRLLGAIPGSAEFRHHNKNPLHLDVLVVDEASMVDLSMMVKLVDALPSHARLILLGDKDQLASVEAGAVLGDICSFIDNGYSAAQGKLLSELTGFHTLGNSVSSTHSKTSHSSVADSLCMLQKSYRFDARSGIGQLAKAINSGRAAKVDEVWNQDFSDINHYPLSSDNYNQMIKSLVDAYSVYLQRAGKRNKADVITDAVESLQLETMASEAKAVLKAFSQSRLLCAVREGDFGVLGLNHRIERALAARNLIKTQQELWYHGRPVMVTLNDHALGLYNGDIGICMRDEEDAEQRLKVYFELPDGSVKAVLPSRVPQHETAFAMTIHKSQGSEFEFTAMILPPEYSPIVTRELIYTGITRAKERLALYCDIGVLKRGIQFKTERASGLVERLKG
ncbi:exodeoxyribonuclease V subunit alpha [Vibrio plantisponsor]|uniref:RecBCD enzyme subunit RecD n=1 Tax=Vibrio plantisponsor TaxID=664643 RepID=A0ABU4IH86_9VIBR|nr:exodeoxyribonuclease V subunit alpha [Vibrio plantisponsor]MDW6017923.1 exodeoxyribonuclease V subunit alpha [Vibrio plantisponsor]NNM39668.1 exodeoxyribonuclease V subunit alpha [Vibrio plantisponsor]